MKPSLAQRALAGAFMPERYLNKPLNLHMPSNLPALTAPAAASAETAAPSAAVWLPAAAARAGARPCLSML